MTTSNCPKCRAKRNPGDVECQQCGVIFARVTSAKAKKIAAKKTVKTSAAKPKEKMDEKQKELATQGFVILGAVILCIVWYLWPTGSDQAAEYIPPQTATPIYSGSIKQDLGMQSSFGSENQAIALLDLIDRNQDKADLQISYTTDMDTVIFGCNLNKKAIIRLHTRPDGHGNSEVWIGDVLYRLKTTAAGKSLNDTPSGKSFADTQSF